MSLETRGFGVKLQGLKVWRIDFLVICHQSDEDLLNNSLKRFCVKQTIFKVTLKKHSFGTTNVTVRVRLK